MAPAFQVTPDTSFMHVLPLNMLCTWYSSNNNNNSSNWKENKKQAPGNNIEIIMNSGMIHIN